MNKAKERLAKLRERAETTGDKKRVEPVIQSGQSPDFSMMRFYDKIRANPTKTVIEEAAEYYDTAVKDGTYYVVPVGNLEELQLQQPGLNFFYRGIYVDAQQSRRWLEERLERLESQKHNYYMYSEDARAEHGVLKTTEAGKLAKADPEVMEMSDMVRLMAFHEHNLERLMEAFENIKYVLNNVVTVRKEKLEEVWVDPTQETRNV